MSRFLRCPNTTEINGIKYDCESENIIHKHTDLGLNDEGICRDCFYKAPIEEFIEAYQNQYEDEGQPEYERSETV